MRNIATDFLTRCFAPGETIAVLLRRENPISTSQRIVLIERALAPRYLGWLAHENSTGTNIYVAANPLRSGSRKRTKESIESVRHLYIDIDTDGDAHLATLRASDTVPPPTVILSTSPGKYQALWRVEDFDFERQEQTLKLLTIAFGSDPACTDCNRVLRIPGFLNCKYDPAHRVTVEYPCDSIWTPADFRLDVAAVDTMLFDHAVPSRKQPGKHSNSESDWAWVSHEPAQGKDAVKLTWNWLRGVPISRTHSITHNVRSMSHQPGSSLSKAYRSTTLSLCSNPAAASRFPPHFAPLVRGRL